MDRVVVTGANGFLGSSLCRALAKKYTEVIAVVRDENENVDGIKSLGNIRIVYSDLSNFRHLASIINEKNIETLFHLAWVGSAGPLRADADVQMKNIQYTCDTVRACREMNCKRIVFASSIMEYEVAALMETDMTPGINTLYCSAKVAADYMARTLAGELGIIYIRAVISNIYGPGETSPRLINSSLRKLINGEHCSFSAGNQMYDFIYIDDAAKAFVSIGEKGKANRTYYIGSKKPKPLKEFLIEMKNQVDPNIKIGLGELDFNGISLSYKEFDINRVEKDTGFVPVISFAEGIRNTISWIKGE